MIRIIKWKENQMDLGDTVNLSFASIVLGNFHIIFNKFSGGFSLSAGYKNSYELIIFTKKKREDLIEFGFKETVEYVEFFK